MIKSGFTRPANCHHDYQPNFGKGFDSLWLEFAGVDEKQFLEVVRNSITDGQVCDWVLKNVKKPGGPSKPNTANA